MRAADPAAVARALALRTMLPANWHSGLVDVRDVGTFVSPPVDGFVFVTGADVVGFGAVEQDVAPRLARLSAEFGFAAWFRSDDAADAYGWACARDGELARAYAFAGEHGPVAWEGDVDDVERALGCHVDDPRDKSDDEVKWWPDRRIVHALAAAWAVDPDELSQRGGAAGVGVVGRMGPAPAG
ncbi:MAG: hypothetical protein FJ301_04055 [Planctomycetes bacterium]|nr:hypothetical protein [Planctomycetota bacterium]